VQERQVNSTKRLIAKIRSLNGNGNIYIFIFSFERTVKIIYNTLLPFFHILLTSTNILIERTEMHAITFCRYACHVTTGVTQDFLSRQPLIILQSKLYSLCPSKYQDHSKPLKHLPINIWSATNTFIWLIPVVR
jgi:hypothetical protein